MRDMFCTKCGNQVTDGAAFCPACGNPLHAVGSPPPTQQPHTPPTQRPYSPPPPQQQPPYTPPVRQPYIPQPPYGGQAQALPLNWHKFLIYFSLWAGGILCILNGIALATGLIYSIQADVSSELIYSFYPILRACDLLFGVFFVAQGVFAIFTRFQLAGFRRNAPKLLLGVYALGAVGNILYTIAVSIIVMADASTIVQTVSSVSSTIVLIVCNNIYYQKREMLFCN